MRKFGTAILCWFVFFWKFIEFKFEFLRLLIWGKSLLHKSHYIPISSQKSTFIYFPSLFFFQNLDSKLWNLIFFSPQKVSETDACNTFAVCIPIKPFPFWWREGNELQPCKFLFISFFLTNSKQKTIFHLLCFWVWEIDNNFNLVLETFLVFCSFLRIQNRKQDNKSFEEFMI